MGLETKQNRSQFIYISVLQMSQLTIQDELLIVVQSLSPMDET